MSTPSKIILVTGASSGIGRATANYLAKQGHTVYGAGRKFNQLEAIDEFIGLKMDVTEPDSIQSGLNLIIEKEAKIDVLINNAGLGLAGPVEECHTKDFEAVMNTNVLGVLNMVQAVCPYLRRQNHGYIINITSIGAKFSLPFRGIYCASKSAVEAITEALSMELRPFGIRVCTVAPGDVKTNINANRIHSSLEQSEYPNYKQVLQQINQEVNAGINPQVIGEKIEHIIQQRKPKLHYRVATPIQRISVWMKQLLPGRIFERLIMNHYNV